MSQNFDLPAWVHRLEHLSHDSGPEVWAELQSALHPVMIEDMEAREAFMGTIEKAVGGKTPANEAPDSPRRLLQKIWQAKDWRWNLRHTAADPQAWQRELVNAVHARLPGVVRGLLEGAPPATVRAFLESSVSFAGQPILRPLPPMRPGTHGYHLRSPWAELVEHHSPEMVQVWLDHGADPQGEHIQGSPLLAHATTPDMVALLLAAGSDPLNPELPFVQRERFLQELWYSWAFYKIPNTLAYMQSRMKDWTPEDRIQALSPLHWIMNAAWSRLSSWDQGRYVDRHAVLRQAWSSLSQGRPPSPPQLAGERVRPSAFSCYLRWRQFKESLLAGGVRWRRARARPTPGLGWEWLEQVVLRNHKASYPWANHDAASAVQAWVPALVDLLGREGSWRAAWEVAAPLVSGPLKYHRILEVLRPAQDHVLATNSHHLMFDAACTMWAMNRQHVRKNGVFLSKDTVQAWLKDPDWDHHPRAIHWAAVLLLHTHAFREPCSPELQKQASQRYIALCARHEEGAHWHGPDPDEALHAAIRIMPVHQDLPRLILVERLHQGIASKGAARPSLPRPRV